MLVYSIGVLDRLGAIAVFTLFVLIVLPFIKLALFVKIKFSSVLWIVVYIRVLPLVRNLVRMDRR